MTIHSVVLIISFHVIVNQRTTDLIVRGLTIAAVEESALHLVTISATAVASLLILVHGQHRHLQHGVRQQRGVPFRRIRQ